MSELSIDSLQLFFESTLTKQEQSNLLIMHSCQFEKQLKFFLREVCVCSCCGKHDHKLSANVHFHLLRSVSQILSYKFNLACVHHALCTSNLSNNEQPEINNNSEINSAMIEKESLGKIWKLMTLPLSAISKLFPSTSSIGNEPYWATWREKEGRLVLMRFIIWLFKNRVEQELQQNQSHHLMVVVNYTNWNKLMNEVD